jgi:hypothetical protein
LPDSANSLITSLRSTKNRIKYVFKNTKSTSLPKIQKEGCVIKNICHQGTAIDYIKIMCMFKTSECPRIAFHRKNDEDSQTL